MYNTSRLNLAIGKRGGMSQLQREVSKDGRNTIETLLLR